VLLACNVAHCAMEWNVQQPKRSLAESDCSHVRLVDRIDLEPGLIRNSECIICLRFGTSLVPENAALTTANASLLNCKGLLSSGIVALVLVCCFQSNATDAISLDLNMVLTSPRTNALSSAKCAPSMPVLIAS